MRMTNLYSVTVAFLLWSCCKPRTVSSINLKEFSLARFSTTSYANNSVIDINLVGEGFSVPRIKQTDGGALECHTDDTTCCRGRDNPPNGVGRGEWYYPNGTVVPPPGGGLFYRTRDHMVLRLNRVGYLSTLLSTGVYSCVIPGAGGVTITRYIALENKLRCNDLPVVTNGTVTYTPHRSVSGGLPAGQRYTGTIATYNCSSGYQLVGGSSLRACGPDGNWNGTEPTCEDTTTEYTATEITIEATTEEITSEETTTATLAATDPSTTDSPVVFIQLRFTNIPSCQEYSILNTQLKIDSIIATITKNIAMSCACQFNSSFLSNSQLQCFDESPQIVTFRTQISDTRQTSTTELVLYIEQWIQSSEGLVVEGFYLAFGTSCPLVIESFDSIECPGSLDVQEGNIGGIVGGAIFAVLLAVVIIFVIIVVCYLKRKQANVDIELYDLDSPVPNHEYEVVDLPVEYEEIDKFHETRGNSEMIEQTHKGDYEYTECPAYNQVNKNTS